MGLLTFGTGLSWNEIEKYKNYVKKKGIRQVINMFKKHKDHQTDSFKWGDEMEFQLVKFDHENKKVYLLLKGDYVLKGLEEKNNGDTHWTPEFANYMVEGTPGRPYDDRLENFALLQSNMNLRREQVQEFLGRDEYIMSITSFPRLGCRNFTWPHHTPTPTQGNTHSLFYPDQAIFNEHPRFGALSKNIRERRKSKVCINVPIYKDTNTPSPFVEDLLQYGDVNNESSSVQKVDHIYMDSMGFGAGCSCLQMTFQAQSITEARHLYDQLTPITPVILALSAASPIWRGYLSDVDCRWNVISASVDDRTTEERGESPLHGDNRRILKSRYDALDCYLSKQGRAYNDIKLAIDQDFYGTLRKNGMDHLLSQHFAHLFIRDPLTLIKETIDMDDETETDHFENIQSTNWQNMRFKPPPITSTMGWRVEFRPTELQLTDFENAAFVTFIILLSRAILSYNLNLLVPMTKVNENMQVALKRDACCVEKFYFRKVLHTNESIISQSQENEYGLMTINEIINGKDDFPGLIPIVKDYLASIDVDVQTLCTIKQYLRLIEHRAKGDLLTMASWMRDFVQNHEKYEHDSKITDEIAYDLLWKMHLISTGKATDDRLFFTDISD